MGGATDMAGATDMGGARSVMPQDFDLATF
jgi:hypothetical protein